MAGRKTIDEMHYENIFSNNVNFKERKIYFNSDVDEYALPLFQKALDEMEKQTDKSITVEISTYGGDVDEMFGIVDRIRSSECEIITRGFGKIMSAGTFILGSGYHRCAGWGTQFMCHELYAEIEGTLKDLKNEIKQLERSQDQMYTLYERFTGTDASKWKKLMNGKSYYITAQEALDLGLIDEIIGDDNE